MREAIFVDWLPYSSAAIQTNVIQAGSIPKNIIDKVGSPNKLSSVCYALRLDGLFVFWVVYESDVPDSPSEISGIIDDGNVVSELLRKEEFDTILEHPRMDQVGRLLHGAVLVEDLFSGRFNNRLSNYGANSIGNVRPTSNADRLSFLKQLCNSDLHVALICRHSPDPLKSEHFACLYLKAMMGSAKTRAQSRLETLKYQQEVKNKNFKYSIIALLMFSIITTLALSIFFVVSELSLREGSLLLKWNMDVLANDIITMQNFRFFLISIAFSGALATFYYIWTLIFRVHAPRMRILVMGISYLAECSEYSSGVSKLYEVVNLSGGRSGRIYHVHQRGFVGAIEELNVLLKDEATKSYNEGVVAVLIFAALTFFTTILSLQPFISGN